MKQMFLAAAAGVVLAANGWGLLHAWRNQTESSGGQLELTERELRLQPVVMESTVTVLRLDWRVQTAGNQQWARPVWLDTAKLEALGFDCKVPVSGPEASSHYSSMPARRVFLALEYEGDTWRSAGGEDEKKSRLFVVDADQDAIRLRRRYPDREHHIICRGSVRLVFRHPNLSDASSAGGPAITGRVESIHPGYVFVPLPYSRILRGLQGNDFERHGVTLTTEPRYAVQICWGANHEPWVEGVRLDRLPK
jgi:hypothetical protein